MRPVPLLVRSALAAAVSAVAGLVTGVAVVTLLHHHRSGCTLERSGEGAGSWSCPDGVAYLVPTVGSAAVVALLLFGTYLALEVSRASRPELRLLSSALVVLGSSVLAGSSLLFLLLAAAGSPELLVVSFVHALSCAAALWALRLGPRPRLALWSGTALLVALSAALVLPAPTAAAALSCGVGALAVRVVERFRFGPVSGAL